jgi:hypothetical protein
MEIIMHVSQRGYGITGNVRNSQEKADRQTFNQEVMGSNPIALTNEIKYLDERLNIKRNRKPRQDNVQDNIRLISLPVGRRPAPRSLDDRHCVLL